MVQCLDRQLDVTNACLKQRFASFVRDESLEHAKALARLEVSHFACRQVTFVAQFLGMGQAVKRFFNQHVEV